MKTNSGLRHRALASIAMCMALLASCGGGEPIEQFVPVRLIVIGDESSVINPDGSKHTVNALVSGTTTLDCAANAIWVQIVGNAYRLEFSQCPIISGAAVSAFLFAAAGAKVADISAQIDAVGAFREREDLVTILAGANDIFAQYALFNTTVNGVLQTEAVLTGAVESLGEALAVQVNRVADAGGRVLISTVPDLGLTPFALSEEAVTPGRAAMLSRLAERFNARLRIKIINDGRRIGLLLTDELVQALVQNPGGNGLVNVTRAACDTALAPVVTSCTTATLVTGASASGNLWANDRLMSPGGHSRLGNLALTRAANNPF